MATIHQLITELEQGGDERSRSFDPSAANGVPDEVIKFAPKKIRFHHQSAQDRIDELEGELRQWQERADRAELRLRSIEKSIQQIAARYLQGAARE